MTSPSPRATICTARFPTASTSLFTYRFVPEVFAGNTIDRSIYRRAHINREIPVRAPLQFRFCSLNGAVLTQFVDQIAII